MYFYMHNIKVHFQVICEVVHPAAYT